MQIKSFIEKNRFFFVFLTNKKNREEFCLWAVCFSGPVFQFALCFSPETEREQFDDEDCHRHSRCELIVKGGVTKWRRFLFWEIGKLFKFSYAFFGLQFLVSMTFFLERELWKKKIVVKLKITSSNFDLFSIFLKFFS